MKIIIDISEKEYRNARQAVILNFDAGFPRLGYIYENIAEGIIIPEDYRRLIDVKDIRIKPEYMHNIGGEVMIRVEDLTRILNDAKTIL